MAVQILGNSVVVPISIIESNYPGGFNHFREMVNTGFCADHYLARVPFMNGHDMDNFVKHLVEKGLAAPSRDKMSSDIAMLDSEGLFSACDWLELGWKSDGSLYVWLKGMSVGNLVGEFGVVDDRMDVPPLLDANDLSPEPPPLTYAPQGTLPIPPVLFNKLQEMYKADLVTYSEVVSMTYSHMMRLCKEDLQGLLQFLHSESLNIETSPLYYSEGLSRRELRNEIRRIAELAVDKLVLTPLPKPETGK